MLSAWKHGLRNLFNPNGRDARQTFWYYVLLIFIVQFILGMVMVVPMIISIFSTIADAIKQNADPAALEGRMMAAITGDLANMLWLSIGVSVLSGLALVASLVRRLHDSDLSGWWAALPGAIYAISLSQAPEQMRRTLEMMATMDLKNPPNQYDMLRDQGLMGLVIYVAYGLVIYAGVRKSTPGPNCYGDAPVSF